MKAARKINTKFNTASFPQRRPKTREVTAEAVFALKFRAKRVVEGNISWGEWSWVTGTVSEWHPVMHWWLRRLMTLSAANEIRGRLQTLGFDVKRITIWRKTNAYSQRKPVAGTMENDDGSDTKASAAE